MKVRFTALLALLTLGIGSANAAMEWNDCGVARNVEYYPGDGTSSRPASVVFECLDVGERDRLGFRTDTPRGAQMLAALQTAQNTGKNISVYSESATYGFHKVYWLPSSGVWENANVGMVSVLKVH